MADDDKSGVTLEQVKALLADALKGKGPAAAKDPAAGDSPSGDVTTQVEAAVARVHAGQAADAERKAIADRLAALETREPEKKPREFRAITRKIWGTEDDE